MMDAPIVNDQPIQLHEMRLVCETRWRAIRTGQRDISMLHHAYIMRVTDYLIVQKILQIAVPATPPVILIYGEQQAGFFASRDHGVGVFQCRSYGLLDKNIQSKGYRHLHLFTMNIGGCSDVDKIKFFFFKQFLVIAINLFFWDSILRR